jgi:hypothetical protein
MIYWLIDPTTEASTSLQFHVFHPDQPQRVSSNRLLTGLEYLAIEVQVGANWAEVARINSTTNVAGYRVEYIGTPHRVVKPVSTNVFGAYLDMF